MDLIVVAPDTVDVDAVTTDFPFAKSYAVFTEFAVAANAVDVDDVESESFVIPYTDVG